MSNYEKIEPICICNLFDGTSKYEIPLYQRAYAWEDDQIRDLIEDIDDVDENQDGLRYCLGSLIVSEKDSIYEVIDGQQRLTTLYLLLNILQMPVSKTLSFANRDKSSKALLEIDLILNDFKKLCDDSCYQNEILNGIKLINKYLPCEKRESFIKKLSHVYVYRIPVPKHTDLNHYFEIMNTRGEQLEQTDVLKARLMGYLSNDEKRCAVFAKIWDACSDMTGYVQMHFTPKERNRLFGGGWDDRPHPSYKKGGYKSFVEDGEHVHEKTIKDIVKDDFRIEKNDGSLEDDKNVRFESVIEFKHFLLHVLKVYVATYMYDDPDNLVARLIDDKKLIENFENVEQKGYLEERKISTNKSDFAFSFVICLLRCRFLFDKYIIKREFVDEDKIGAWSLRELKVSGQQSKKKPYYVNTWIQKKYDRDKDRSRRCLMLQAALRVSYTSPKIMHWITDLLIWLIQDDYANIDSCLNEYETYIESLIQSAVKSDFLEKSDEEKFNMGLKTPHIVFNYLDYQIWKNNRRKFDKFVFEFRNSVEHWYPQNPSKGTFPKWKHEDGVDQFGNLCLVPSNINSSFSNLDPEAKKKTFKEEVAKGSLKLREMAKLTEDAKNASLKWKDEVCAKHGAKMMKILEHACGCC